MLCLIIKYLPKKRVKLKKNILIRVHCYGGSVMEGNVIYNSIKNSKAYVTLMIEGVSASMMSIVMLAADKVIIADNGLVMIHCPSGYTTGTAKDHLSAAKMLTKMEANFVKTIRLKTGKPETEVKALFDGSDHWFDAEEALEWKLVTDIAPAVVKDIKKLDKPDASMEVVAVYNRYQALLVDDSEIFTQTDISMKKPLIAALGLTGVTEASSDADIIAAVMAKQNTPAPTTLAAATNDAKASAETVLASIEKFTGKSFEAAARATLLGVGEKAGLEAMQGVMALMTPTASAEQPVQTAAIPQVLNMLGGAQSPAATGRETWTWDTYQEKDPEALEVVMKSEPDKFKALYRAKYKAEPDMS